MHRVAISHKRRSLLESRARELRSRLTPSEAALWNAISGNQVGVHFRRQHNIGRFIVDFVAVRPRLVVESMVAITPGANARTHAGIVG